MGDYGLGLVMEGEVSDTSPTVYLKWTGSAGGTLFHINGGTNINVSDITFSGNKTALYAVRIQYNEVTNRGCSSVRFYRCVIRDATGTGSACVAIGRTATPTLQCDTMAFTHCQFLGDVTTTCEWGVKLLQGGNVTDFQFDGCVFGYFTSGGL